jgi:hypothetical protein
MDEYESLSHTKWERKYHVGLIPKCLRRTLLFRNTNGNGDTGELRCSRLEESIAEFEADLSNKPSTSSGIGCPQGAPPATCSSTATRGDATTARS